MDEVSWELVGLVAVLGLVIGWVVAHARRFWKQHRKK